jgi:hypothetical protein
MLFGSTGLTTPIDPINISFLGLAKVASCSHFISLASPMPIVFIHCPYSNPHPPQMGRVWVEHNYPLKKWEG